MRWLTLGLIALITLLQYPLWLGKGGWLRVWDVDRQLQQQKDANRKLEVRNAGLDAEVRDLKQGYDAIEERARFELGMVKQDEVFVQLPEKAPERPTPPPAIPAAKGSKTAR
ncbi:MAG TPA: cell division protein FtsB [Azospira sp.]|nr:cell division protein FtsB [Azospira sp.]